ncbi:uncharacterized protein LY89DRAFT_726841 [Mollisia scopiformis]|uniref:Uncharacterized protein n=1 Tax=Mollisia scopiformis TaxID=149040 RepID=A0A194XTY2_MOLSC|nr:uncharacterized protein LY89DRAFT_726841 [Mollisia scopiformis]KUJ23780.1 hypothetical protein LY89DRAFT_726841 [Mollisia scopiformis]
MSKAKEHDSDESDGEFVDANEWQDGDEDEDDGMEIVGPPAGLLRGTAAAFPSLTSTSNSATQGSRVPLASVTQADSDSDSSSDSEAEAHPPCPRCVRARRLGKFPCVGGPPCQPCVGSGFDTADQCLEPEPKDGRTAAGRGTGWRPPQVGKGRFCAKNQKKYKDSRSKVKGKKTKPRFPEPKSTKPQPTMRKHRRGGGGGRGGRGGSGIAV